MACRSWAYVPTESTLASTLLRTCCTVPCCAARAREMNRLESLASLHPHHKARAVWCVRVGWCAIRPLTLNPTIEPQSDRRQSPAPCGRIGEHDSQTRLQAAQQGARPPVGPSPRPSTRLRQGIAISLHNIEHRRWDFEKIVSKHVRCEKASSA